MVDKNGFTPEGLEDAQREAYMEVLEVFRPIVLGHMRKMIEKEIEATSFTDEDMHEYCLAVRDLAFERYDSEEIADRHMREASRRFLSIEAFPSETRAPALCNDEIVDDMFDTFVSVWLDALDHVATGPAGAKTLDASVLGLDMLPPEMPECEKCGGPSFRWTVFSETQARQMLRFVRSSLPDGKCLPDQVVELLDLHGVTVINLDPASH